MLISRQVRTQPEKVWVLVHNSYSTAALSNGQWVAMDLVTDIDGYSVTKPNGVLRSAIVGCIADNGSTIPVDGYGLCQVYGWNTVARCTGGSGANTSKATAGSQLYCKTSGFAAAAINFYASAATIPVREMHPVGTVGVPTNTAAKATSATTAVFKCFLRCL